MIQIMRGPHGGRFVMMSGKPAEEFVEHLGKLGDEGKLPNCQIVIHEPTDMWDPSRGGWLENAAVRPRQPAPPPSPPQRTSRVNPVQQLLDQIFRFGQPPKMASLQPMGPCVPQQPVNQQQPQRPVLGPVIELQSKVGRLEDKLNNIDIGYRSIAATLGDLVEELKKPAKATPAPKRKPKKRPAKKPQLKAA